jgi:hypothetical protein
MKDLQVVPVVSPQFLLDNVLPSLPTSFDIEKVKQQLHTEKVTNKKGWTAFKKRPKNNSAHESVTFQPLQDLFDGVARCTSKSLGGLEQVLEMQHNPNRAPLSARETMSRPDSILELIKKQSVTECAGAECNWEDIPVAMEFKKGDGEKDKRDVSANLSVKTLSSLWLC